MLIGEAPGAEEDQNGKPFVGGSGRILGRWFYESGVFRGEIFLDNVFSHRPPGNELSTAKPNYLEAYQNLERRIDQVNPRVIIAAGETALRFFGKVGITNWRGSCFEWKGIKIVPTLHPAFIMRVPTMWRFCVEDLRFAFRKAEGWPTGLPLNYVINPTSESLEAYFQSIKDNEEVSLDLETTVEEQMELSAITQVSISTKARQAVVFDMEEQYLLSLLRLLKRPLRWVGQNILMFDSLRLRDLGAPLIQVYADTMLAHHILQSPAPHDLGFIVSCTIRYPYFKDEISKDRRRYAAKDADSTLQAWWMIRDELILNQQWNLFQVVMKAAHYVRAMFIRGVPVDKQIITEAARDLKVDASALVDKLKELTGNRWFNPRSSKDCKELLYEKLRLPTQYNRKGRERIVTTDDDALVKLSSSGGKGGEAAKLILACRRPLNDLSKYFRPEAVTADGKWHPDWRIHGTETGRYSCWFHTLPPRVRHVVRQTGKLIAYVDAQQGEFRIAAWCANDARAKEVCNGRYGVHADNAVRIFSRLRGVTVKVEDVTPMMKFYAKFVTFGWLYGREAPSISEQYNIPLSQAQEIVSGLNSEYKRIVIWKAETAREALTHNQLRNPFGRRRFFTVGSDADKEREAYSFVPQSTLHDIVQRAHILVEENIPVERCEVVADMHDALLLVIDPAFQKEEILPLITYEYLPGLTMPFDYEAHEYWFDKRAEEDALGKVVLK
jgi:uracil-DNA glycosylase family 4